MIVPLPWFNTFHKEKIMKKKLLFIQMIFLGLFIQFSFASEELESRHMAHVLAKVNLLNETYGSGNVLVVFDIDNTVLASRQEIGSDQWFDKMAKEGKIDFPELLRMQGTLFYQNTMRVPEEKVTPWVIDQIQKSGNTVFALTSRGHDYSYQTIRELLRNGIDFSKSAPTFLKNRDYYRPELAFNPETVVDEFGFSSEDVKAFKLSKSREVNYLDGVFYTAGQHKGTMLRIFLKKSDISPKAIVFIDDKVKHTKRVQQAFKDSEIEVVTFRYSAEDENVQKFR